MTADPVTVPEPTPPVATPTPPATPLRWPEWFRAFDLALLILAVVLAFLVSSFVSRNADLWRHLASGRLLATFSAPVGGDTFTFTAADRVWVNANWLAEVSFYALYSADPSGAVLVAVKAMAFAAAFAVLVLLRKPEFSLWPWVVAVTLAAIGLCLQAQLRPIVFGWLLHAVFLVVLFRSAPSTGSKWRTPLILGGVTALWANIDTYAFLAPLSVLLLLVGELLHGRLMKPGPAATDADPFPTVPQIPVLLRTLAVSLVALLLNPTFLAGVVRQPVEAFAQLLPFECNFVTKGVLQDDRDLVQLTWSMGQREYYDAKSAIFGRNLNSLVTGLVGFLVLALTVIGYRSGRVSHLALWVGMALLPILVHARFVGAFLIVSAIMLACHLNAIGRRAATLPSSHHAARPLRSFATFGRIITLLALAVLIVLAIPGWLQPKYGERAMDRWVAWSVEPDEGMRRAALLVQGWREDPVKSAALSGERGLNVHPDFGDYAAWYAPAEKTFVTSRYQLHRHELPDLAALRQMIVYGQAPEQAGDRPLVQLMERNGANYVCVGRSLSNSAINYNVTELQGPAQNTAGKSLMNIFWHLDGRFIVVARSDTPDRVRRFAPLVWNVAREAFGPRAPVSEGSQDIAIGARFEGWEFDFLERPSIQPVELSDSKAYSRQAEARQFWLRQETQARVQVYNRKVLTGYLLGGGAIFFQARQTPPPQVQQDDADFALPLMAVQTARRTTQRNPNDARGYNELALAYTLQVPELEPGENRIQVLTALSRAEVRQPVPMEGEQPRELSEMLEVQSSLYKYHLVTDTLQDQHLDLARVALGNVNKLLSANSADEINRFLVMNMWNDWYTALWVELATFNRRSTADRPPTEQLMEILVQQKMLEPGDDLRKWNPRDPSEITFDFVVDRLRKLETSMKEAIRRRNDIAERQPAEARFQFYMQLGLPGKAIELARDADTARTKVPEEYVLGVLYKVGWLESAHVRRQKLEEEAAALSANDPRSQHYRPLLRKFELTEAKLAGDFKRAELLLEEEFKLVAPPKLTPPELAVLKAESAGYIFGVGSTAGAWPFALTFNNTQVLKQRLYLEAMFLYQRGVMALLNGDNGMAKTHFDNATRPQGVELSVLGIPPESMELGFFLPKYRELLEKYAQPAK